MTLASAPETSHSYRPCSANSRARRRADLGLPRLRAASAAAGRDHHVDLIRRQEQAGLHAVNGWNMLVYQGAAAFEKWTGVEPPVDVMKHALAQSMKEE